MLGKRTKNGLRTYACMVLIGFTYSQVVWADAPQYSKSSSGVYQPVMQVDKAAEEMLEKQSDSEVNESATEWENPLSLPDHPYASLEEEIATFNFDKESFFLLESERQEVIQIADLLLKSWDKNGITDVRLVVQRTEMAAGEYAKKHREGIESVGSTVNRFWLSENKNQAADKLTEMAFKLAAQKLQQGLLKTQETIFKAKTRTSQSSLLDSVRKYESDDRKKAVSKQKFVTPLAGVSQFNSLSDDSRADELKNLAGQFLALSPVEEQHPFVDMLIAPRLRFPSLILPEKQDIISDSQGLGREKEEAGHREIERSETISFTAEGKLYEKLSHQIMGTRVPKEQTSASDTKPILQS